MLLKDELKSIISGTGFVTKGTAIQAVANHIRKSKAAGAIIEEKQIVKEQEAGAILEYVSLHDFFFSNILRDRFLAKGLNRNRYYFILVIFPDSTQTSSQLLGPSSL